MDRAGVIAGGAPAKLEDGRGPDTLALCLMSFLLASSVGMSLIPVVQDGLEHQFALRSSQIGLLTSLFMVAFALGAIPMGMAAVRWGGRILIVSALVFAAGSLIFAFSSSFGGFLAGRLVQGIGASAAIPVSNHLLAHLVAPRRLARALGIFGSGHGLGVVAALLIMPSVYSAGGHRAVFIVAAGLGVVLSGVAAAQRHIRSGTGTQEAPGIGAVLRDVGSVAANPKVLLLAVVNIGVMAVVVGVLAWTPPFLHDQRGTSLAVAAYLTAGSGAAQILGNIAGAAVMARWGKPFVMLTGTVAMLVTTGLIPLMPGLELVVACVMAGSFLTMTIFPAIMGSVPDAVRHWSQVGAGSGLLGLMNLLGTLFAPWVFGVLLDSYGKGPDGGGYLAGYLWLVLFPLLGTMAAATYLVGRRRAANRAAHGLHQVAKGAAPHRDPGAGAP